MKFLAKFVHGSKLYRLDGPNSDTDIKGIFLPTLHECLLNRAPKNINTKQTELNQETELFSLQEFIKHLCNSENYAIDALHCAESDIIEDSSVWEYIRNNKPKFYTKKMSGLLGYCKNQSTKYALKAERLNAVKSVLNVLKQAENDGVLKLFQIWDKLPQGEHIYYDIELRNNNKDNRYIEVAGKKLPATTGISYSIPILENLINSFGQRVQKASELDEKDTKSLSHSFRTGYQLRSIYKDGGFTYPLAETEFIKDIKFRRTDFAMNFLDEKLNELITEVENLSVNSSYPEKIDQTFADKIILDAYL